MASAKVINYHNGEKIYNKEKVDELLATKQGTLVPDIVVQDSVNVVTNSAVKAYVDAETQRAEAAEGELTNLKTTNKSNLVAAINEVKDSAYTVDKTVTAGSTNPVESTGVKTYVDTHDEATLKSAKDYTDDRIGVLEPGDGTAVVELTGHLGDLKNAAESLVTAINNIDGRVEQNTTRITGLNNDLAAERQARIDGDQVLDTKITQVEQAKQDKLTFDDTPTHSSNNPVTSTGIKDYVDEITGQLGDLNTPAESLVTAINNIDGHVEQNATLITDLGNDLAAEQQARIDGDKALDTKITQVEQAKQDKLTFDDTPTHSSNNPVTSTGIKDYVDEITGHLDDLNTPAESLVTAINNIDGHVEQNATLITDLGNDLAAEQQARIDGDKALDTKITQVEQAKQDKLTFDDTPTHSSNNPVTSTGIKDYVDEITGHLDDLNTPAESLVTAINQLGDKYREPDTAMSDTSENAVQNKVIKEYIDDKDTTPTEGSEKAVKSGGIFDAIRFASVRVGETMYWYLQDDSSPENREVHSNNPFVFNFKGQEMSVETQNGNVQLCTLKDIPEGWHALDGKAELLVTDYPDLASFMPENVTKDGKIWLPYVQHKIIKVKY